MSIVIRQMQLHYFGPLALAKSSLGLPKIQYVGKSLLNWANPVQFVKLKQTGCVYSYFLKEKKIELFDLIGRESWVLAHDGSFLVPCNLLDSITPNLVAHAAS